MKCYTYTIFLIFSQGWYCLLQFSVIVKFFKDIAYCIRNNNNNNNDNNNNDDDDDDDDVELATYKKRYISPEERQQIVDELRLVPKNY